MDKRSGPGIPSVRRRPMEIDGVTYAKMSLAVRALGLVDSTIRKRLNSEDYPNYRWLKPSYKEQP